MMNKYLFRLLYCSGENSPAFRRCCQSCLAKKRGDRERKIEKKRERERERER